MWQWKARVAANTNVRTGNGGGRRTHDNREGERGKRGKVTGARRGGGGPEGTEEGGTGQRGREGGAKVGRAEGEPRGRRA